MGYSTSPDDIARDLAILRADLHNLSGLVYGVTKIINPVSGAVQELNAGAVILGPDGITLQDKNTGAQTADASVKWLEVGNGLNLGSIGAYFGPSNNLATLDVYANMNHGLVSGSSNGGLELAVGSSDSSASNRSWIFLYAKTSVASTQTVMEVYSDVTTVGGVTRSTTPFAVEVNWASSYSQLILGAIKGSAGDPASPKEGSFYINTVDNAVRLYADGAWRSLSSWA